MTPPVFDEIEVQTDVSRRQASRMQGRFLKGPIPMADLWAAARLPGQALALYLAIRHQCDISRSAVVTLPAALLRHFGIGKDTKSRALRSLCAAGLVTVENRCGRSARIVLASSAMARASGDRHDR